MSYKIEKLPNGKYKIRVWGTENVFGKIKTKQISNISGITSATKLAKEIELNLNDSFNKESPCQTGELSFRALDTMYYNERQTKVSPTTLDSTFKSARNKVIDYLGDIKIRNINTTIVQNFIDSQQKTGLKKKTVKNYYAYIKAVLNWGINNDLLDYSRVKKLYYKEDEEEFEATTLDIEQVSKILTKMKTECYNIYIPSLISVLTGARRGEVLGLSWDDIDFENNTIFFRNNLVNVNGKPLLKKKLKTKKSLRENPMCDFLKKQLLNHKENFAYSDKKQVCGNVFMGDISPDYIGHMVHDFIFSEFNIDMREHDLRHTFSQLIEDNEDILTEKSEMMGHSNTYTTKYYYTKPSFIRKYRLANALGELIREQMCEKKCEIV